MWLSFTRAVLMWNKRVDFLVICCNQQPSIQKIWFGQIIIHLLTSRCSRNKVRYYKELYRCGNLTALFMFIHKILSWFLQRCISVLHKHIITMENEETLKHLRFFATQYKSKRDQKKPWLTWICQSILKSFKRIFIVHSVHGTP